VPDRQPILRVARAVRRAVAERHAEREEALTLYDGELYDRLDQAVEFLRVIQRVDAEYDRELAKALYEYRQVVERSWRRPDA
jgi:hypothetical protein